MHSLENLSSSRLVTSLLEVERGLLSPAAGTNQAGASWPLESPAGSLLLLSYGMGQAGRKKESEGNWTAVFHLPLGETRGNSHEASRTGFC